MKRALNKVSLSLGCVLLLSAANAKTLFEIEMPSTGDFARTYTAPVASNGTYRPGYVTTVSNNATVSINYDECKSMASGRTVTRTCYVQDLDGVTIPSGATLPGGGTIQTGASYTLDSSNLPAETEYEWVYYKPTNLVNGVYGTKGGVKKYVKKTGGNITAASYASETVLETRVDTDCQTVGAKSTTSGSTTTVTEELSNPTRLLQKCTTPTGALMPSGWTEGQTYLYGSSSNLPEVPTYYYVYKPQTCSGSGTSKTCGKPGWVEQHKTDASGDIVATIPDKCETVATNESGVAISSGTARGIGQKCYVGKADTGIPSGWAADDAYTVTGIVPRPTYTYTYKSTECTTTTSGKACAAPGYIEQKEGSTVIAEIPDKCEAKSVQSDGKTVATNAANARGIAQICKVGKGATGYPSGFAAGDSYTVTSTPLPAATVMVYVPGTCSNRDGEIGCSTKGYVGEFEEIAEGTYTSYISGGAPASGTTMKKKIVDDCTAQQVGSTRSIKQVCTAGEANLYPAKPSGLSGNWDNSTTYTYSNTISIPTATESEVRNALGLGEDDLVATRDDVSDAISTAESNVYNTLLPDRGSNTPGVGLQQQIVSLLWGTVKEGVMKGLGVTGVGTDTLDSHCENATADSYQCDFVSGMEDYIESLGLRAETISRTPASNEGGGSTPVVGEP